MSNRQNFKTDNGVLISVGTGERTPYYIIYKVYTFQHSPYMAMPMEVIKEFHNNDIREAKRQAWEYYEQEKKILQHKEVYSPEHSYAYDPKKGIGLNFGIMVSVKDLLTGGFTDNHMIETTFTTNENLKEKMRKEAQELIDQFEKAQDNDGIVQENETNNETEAK